MDCVVVALSHRRKLPQGVQLSPCITTCTVENEYVVQWCGGVETRMGKRGLCTLFLFVCCLDAWMLGFCLHSGDRRPL